MESRFETPELRLKAERLRKIHPKEIGLRAGEAAELIEELIREREWREWNAIPMMPEKYEFRGVWGRPK